MTAEAGLFFSLSYIELNFSFSANSIWGSGCGIDIVGGLIGAPQLRHFSALSETSLLQSGHDISAIFKP